MGPTRNPYGRGLGFVNNLNYRGTTSGLFTQSDTTPDVTIGERFLANNTGATVITYFDLQGYGTRQAEYEGKIINLEILDQGSTQLANSSRLVLEGTDNAAAGVGGRTIISFMFSNSSWFELGRTKPSSSGGFSSSTVAGTVSVSALNDTTWIIVNGTGATTIQAISGGTFGQEVNLAMNSGGITYTINSAGNLYIGGTNAFIANISGVYKFIKRNTVSWSLVGTRP